MIDHLLAIKTAFGLYLGQFYAGIYPDTKALRAFANRGLSLSIMMAPGRMIDQVQDMITAYQKNDNSPGAGPYHPGANALFPVILVALSKDYIPTAGDFGGRQVGRQMVALSDEPGSSVYGYRQAMGDYRAQVVIMAAETSTAQSLAAQFALFVGEIPNRRFRVKFPWGQYELDMPCMLETPTSFSPRSTPKTRT